MTTIKSHLFSGLFILLGMTMLSACGSGGAANSDGSNGVGVNTPVETFVEADAPKATRVQTINLETDKVDTFDFLSPWGYDRSTNANRLYPLVVIGCWNESGGFSEQVRKRFPSFYLDFNNYSTETDGKTLANLIDEAISSGYRIDPNRIYLTGFSMGGSGSFKLVRGMLTKDKLFAGIIRVAGQSESVLAEEAMGKTAVWYHIGLTDDSIRVEVARSTYLHFKNHALFASAQESTESDEHTGFSRTTQTLSLNGVSLFKMSEYQGMGHDPSACYRDSVLFDWLFHRSL